MASAETPLTDYPRPNLAVDLVLLTMVTPTADSPGAPALGVVVMRRDDDVPVLPGRMVRERRTVSETLGEVVGTKLGLPLRRRPSVDLLGVYDAPDRDPRGWVVSLGFVLALRPGESDRLDPARAEVLVARGDASRGAGRRVLPERLGYDHDEMVTTAVRRVRRRYERSPDPLGLLRPPYSLSQLRQAHEAVLDAPLKRDTFNRRMREFLEPALGHEGEELFTSESIGRPAQLFQPVSRNRRDPESGPFPLPRQVGS